MPNNENSAGPVIATVIILAVIILGGLYFWGERSNQRDVKDADANSAAAANTDQTTAAIRSQSSSDDISSIEADLNNTNTEAIDADLSAA